jgi:predicted phage baseplate assembly protein
MALKDINLDDRDYQDIVEEAVKHIPQYCEAWTDHNPSDPGITLIELFAWMTDMLLYRLNQVPDMHYFKFMELLGIKLGEPKAAVAPVTFYLSDKRPEKLVIPARTVVATTQTEIDSSIEFRTETDILIQPPMLRAVVKQTGRGVGSKNQVDVDLHRLENGYEPAVDVFSSMPQIDDAFAFGFENDLSSYLLGFDLECEHAEGSNVDPRLPPYIWEAHAVVKTTKTTPITGWVKCDVEGEDTTQALNSIGSIKVHLPKKMHPSRLGSFTHKLFWVRVRHKEISPEEAKAGMKNFSKSPRLRKVSTGSWGATIPAKQYMIIEDEDLGRSDGTPGQRFRLQNKPLLKREKGEHLTVRRADNPPEIWEEKDDFGDSQENDNHYTLDNSTGEIRLPPVVRLPDGTMKRYGSIPPKDARLVFTRYRWEGGHKGVVGPNVIDTLKTSNPFISRVRNREASWGGVDAETVDAASMRVPAILRSRQRAVTASDYEYLAGELFNQEHTQLIGRVKCLQPGTYEGIPGAYQGIRVTEGQVYLLVIPHLDDPSDRLLTKEELTLSDENTEDLEKHLDEYRLLTTRLIIRPPEYQRVAIKVKMYPAPGVKKENVRANALKRLNKFLNPLVGGADGKGWPFSRDLYVADVYQCLQGLPGVLFLKSVEIYKVAEDGERPGKQVDQIAVADHAVIVSGKHEIEFVDFK